VGGLDDELGSVAGSADDGRLGGSDPRPVHDGAMTQGAR
jgi:hypothetical protein